MMIISLLKTYMNDFSIQELKLFLGSNLVDLLLEWTPDNESLITRTKLIEMIETIHGNQILKNKNFRRSLLLKLSEEARNSFLDKLNIKNRKINQLELIDIIANKSWGNNNISNHFLEILNIDDYFGKEELKDVYSKQQIDSFGTFYELLDYQFIIKEKILNILQSNVEVPRLLVHMPTGTGKTKTSVHTIIHHLNFNLNNNGLIIWMAHTKELLEQAHESIVNTWKFIGMGPINVYKVWGNHKLEIDDKFNGIMICGYQKLISIMRNDKKTFRNLQENVNLVVVDEAHKAVAKETKKVINELMRKKKNDCDRALIGLSATPGRDMQSNGENQSLVSFFENRLISIDLNVLNQLKYSKVELNNLKLEKDIIQYLQSQNILAKIVREKISYGNLTDIEIKKIKIQANNNGYNDYSRDFLETIARNKQRNMKILNKLIELETLRIPTIVFACSVEHGKLLSSALHLRGIKNACVFGEMDDSLRENVIKKFKDKNDDLNILINYEVLTTGFDATNIECVLITRPTQSIVLYSQMIGRGLRGLKMGGNQECLLVDIEDNLDKYTNESMAFNYFNNYWN